MAEAPEKRSIESNGRLQYRLRSMLRLYWSTLYVSFRRLIYGPLQPNWSWMFEITAHFMKTQNAIGFDLPTIAESREYEDALVFTSDANDRVQIEAVELPVKGHWYRPKRRAADRVMLYLHGGGFVHYVKAHKTILSLVTLSAETCTFAPDYSLAPEHAYPTQLEEALAAYCWLLECGTAPERLVVAGDSAGGNLTVALLLKLREVGLPLPALAIGLGPWLDLSNSGASMNANQPYDWIEKRMADRWSDWYCHGVERNTPLVSPIHGDLRGLPPIYIQAGGAEILLDMCKAFAERGASQGNEVTLDIWPGMIHDFQAFGDMTRESAEALRRIGEVVRKYLN